MATSTLNLIKSLHPSQGFVNYIAGSSRSSGAGRRLRGAEGATQLRELLRGKGRGLFNSALASLFSKQAVMPTVFGHITMPNVRHITMPHGMHITMHTFVTTIWLLLCGTLKGIFGIQKIHGVLIFHNRSILVFRYGAIPKTPKALGFCYKDYVALTFLGITYTQKLILHKAVYYAKN